MFYIYFYLFCMALIVVLGWVLGRFIERGTVSFRTARWVATLVSLLTVIPASFCVGWAFAIGVTLLLSVVINYIFWGTEQLIQQIALKKLRVGK